MQDTEATTMTSRRVSRLLVAECLNRSTSSLIEESFSTKLGGQLGGQRLVRRHHRRGPLAVRAPDLARCWRIIDDFRVDDLVVGIRWGIFPTCVGIPPDGDVGQTSRERLASGQFVCLSSSPRHRFTLR